MNVRDYMDIKIKKINSNAKSPTIHKGNNKIIDIYADEEVYIAPGETVTVKTGLAFIFPDDMGIMFMPQDNLHKKTSLRFPGVCMVLENRYYFKDEVKIYLQNTYCLKGETKKVSEYKLIDGTKVIDPHKLLYIEGTVKICKGDCIAQMMPVDAAYLNEDEIPKGHIINEKK